MIKDKGDNMFKNILFIIMMSPLYLSFYNRLNGIEHPVHTYHPIKWNIWEQQEDFGTAFKIARALLGSSDVFTWNGKQYTTLYKEEL